MINEKLANMITTNDKETGELNKEIKAVKDLIEKDQNMQKQIEFNI